MSSMTTENPTATRPLTLVQPDDREYRDEEAYMFVLEACQDALTLNVSPDCELTLRRTAIAARRLVGLPILEGVM